jgi:hypothetical protein
MVQEDPLKKYTRGVFEFFLKSARAGKFDKSTVPFKKFPTFAWNC